MHEGHEEAGAVPRDAERIGQIVVDAAVAVHRALGLGLLESVYGTCLAEELRQRGLKVERQVGVPVAYRAACMDLGFGSTF